MECHLNVLLVVLCFLSIILSGAVSKTAPKESKETSNDHDNSMGSQSRDIQAADFEELTTLEPFSSTSSFNEEINATITNDTSDIDDRFGLPPNLVATMLG